MKRRGNVKRLFYFVCSVLLGVAGVLGYQKYLATERAQTEAVASGEHSELDRRTAESQETPAAVDDPSEASRDELVEVVTPALGLGGEVSIQPSAFEASPTPRREKYKSDVPMLGGDLIVEVDPSSESPGSVEVTPSPLLGASVAELLEADQEARTALENGELQRGLSIFRDIFRATRDRTDVHVAAAVRKLVELAPQDPARLEYFEYLSIRDPDESWRFRSGLAVGQDLAKRRKAEDVRRAWDVLSRAYKAARGKSERQSVLRVLEPFLQEHVFRGRFSPLVRIHAVRQGESLSVIASKYGTTVDAIVRLNRLGTLVIQPGRRLVVLPGKVEVFVKKSDYRLWVLVDGKVLMEKRVGLGRDNCTPESTFVIDQRQKDPTWYRRGKASIPPGDPANILGTRWLGFKDTEEYQGFGIHGTRDASSIGTQKSSGCVRLTNGNIEELYDFVPLETVATITD